MKLVSKSEGAINATSPLIDFEYFGKFEARNEHEMVPHTNRKKVNLLMNYILSNFDLELAKLHLQNKHHISFKKRKLILTSQFVN